MKIKTSELTGAALDWAVAVALGYEMARVPPDANGENAGSVLVPPGFPSDTWSWPRKGKVAINCFVQPYSTDWAQGGPLIDQFEVGIDQSGKESYAYITGFDLDGSFAKSTLVAICRAVVAHKLGDEVEVPDELAQGGAV